MKIYLFGQRNILGGGTHFSGFCDALKSMSVFGEMVCEVAASGKKVAPIVHQIQPEDVSILFFPTISEQFIKGTIIKWAIFETDVLPESYIDYLNRSHLIWVPSSWAKVILQNHGIASAKVHIVHEGVDPAMFHPFARQAQHEDDVFRFYMCGKNEARKGFDELLKGFRLAFDNDPKVVLCLKADHFWGTSEQIEAKQQALIQQIGHLGVTNIVPIFKKLSVQDMALINTHCDAFVFPSRAEGWGLPLIEAIACGLPAVSTYHSGHTEYLSAMDDKFVRLSHQLHPIECPEFIGHWGKGGSWAVAAPEEIARGLLSMKEGCQGYKAKALLASDIIRRDFSWLRAAEQALASLTKMNFLISI
jgi:glycosyltransferase involved in cell wall biosynthesis